jgi:heme-degrading monooxygenase HmoA
MQKVIMILKVKDYDEWKWVYEDNTVDRKIHGSKEVYIYRNKEDPNEIVLIAKWDTMDNAREFFESSDLKKIMQDAGVLGEPIIYYVDEVERTIA